MVRELLAHVVQEMGHQLVANCATVDEAKTMLPAAKPELVVIDWMLPDGRGFDVVRALVTRLPRTRWLFVSSNERGHVVREAIALGVQGFVLKRSDVSTFREGVRRVLAGEKYYCPHSARLLVEKLVDESGSVGTTLTPRDREVLRGFARGENPKALAHRIGVSTKTVQNHLTLLKDKLNLREPAQLVHYAIKHGYIEEP